MRCSALNKSLLTALLLLFVANFAVGANFVEKDFCKDTISNTELKYGLNSPYKYTLKNPNSITPFQNTPAFRIMGPAIPFFSLALAAFHFDDKFFDMRSDHIPTFKHSYDDYLQYGPAAVMLVMKASGVEGRSSWGRMATSDAFSIAIMATLVNSLKYSIARPRPDGSANNSFPSGHTTTAFMTATMLLKEYGETRSPLYSVLGYSMATATAVTRMMNNRHWMSDVLMGAGLGIISTELGYYLADLIFKDKGLKRKELTLDPKDYFTSPSSFSIDAGYSVINQKLTLPNGIGIKGRGGVTMAVNGAYFPTQNYGVGLSFKALTAPYSVDYSVYNQTIDDRRVESSQFELASIAATFNFSYPVRYGVLLGAKLGPSLNFYQGNNINSYDAINQNPITEVVFEKSLNMGVDSRLSATKLISPSLGFALYIDYSYISGKYSGKYLELNRQNYNPVSKRQVSHIFTVGASATALLFSNRHK